MPPSRDAVVVAATLDDVRHGSAVDFQAGGYVPAEIGRSDHNQASARLTRSEVPETKARTRTNLLT